MPYEDAFDRLAADTLGQLANPKTGIVSPDVLAEYITALLTHATSPVPDAVLPQVFIQLDWTPPGPGACPECGADL